MQTNGTWVTITYRYKCSMVFEIAVVESLFLTLNETRDGCFNTSCGIKIIVPFFTTRLRER